MPFSQIFCCKKLTFKLHILAFSQAAVCFFNKDIISLIYNAC